MKKTLYICFFIFELFILFVSYFYNFDDFFYNYIVSSLLMLNSIFFVHKSSKNTIIFFISLGVFYFNYSIAMAFYFQHMEIYYHLFKILPQITWNKAIVVLTIFLSVFVTVLKKSNKQFHIKKYDNKILYFICTLYVFFVSVLSLVVKSNLIQKLAEYSIIFGIVGLLSTKKPMKQYLLVFGLLICVLSNMLLYGRAVALQILFIIAVFYFICRLKKGTILFFSIVGVLFMVYFGMVGDSMGVEKVDFDTFVNVFMNKQLTSDTAVYAFYCSATSVDAISIYESSFRFEHLFFSSVFSFLGGEGMSALFPNVPSYMYSLQELTSLNYIHWNGGIMPFYFNFWLGVPGIVFSAWLTGYIFNKTIVKRDKKMLEAIVGIYIVVSYMRWYLYLPYLRGVCLIFEIYIVLRIIGVVSYQRSIYKKSATYGW